MFSSLFSDLNNAILAARLERVEQILHDFQASTREDYQAEVYSEVNRVLALGNHMQELAVISPETPAKVGDLNHNLTRLNQDGSDIAAQLLLQEDAAGRLYNLAATSQNQLRQLVRELILSSNQRRYIEAFLNDEHVAADHTAALDFQAGIATLPLTNQTAFTPAIAIGSNSLGATSSEVSTLLDDKIETALVWNGPSLELIMTFPTVVIINRVKIDLDDYQGLELTGFTTSPDGSLREDVLIDLAKPAILLNGIAGKYSGDIVIDFPPRHCKQIRMVIEDRVGLNHIALRAISFWQRQYGSAGQVTSLPFSVPTGSVLFTVEQSVAAPLVTITHQISYNGVHFTAIQPGALSLGSRPAFYRAVLTRNSSLFSNNSPLVTSALDPNQTNDFTLAGTTTTPLGDNMLERTLSFTTITGPVVLRETPLVGTLQIQQGAIILAASDYAFTNNTISFPGPVSGVVISYQTSALGSASLAARENFYSPYLYQVRFDQQ